MCGDANQPVPGSCHLTIVPPSLELPVRAIVRRLGLSGRSRSAGRTGPDLVRAAAVGGATAYAAVLLLARWLPVPVVLATAGVQAAALAFVWARRGWSGSFPLVAGLWAPLHLLILSTGGVASPLLPAVVPWIVLAAARVGFAAAAALAGTGVLLLVGAEAWTAVLTSAAVLEAGVVGVSGLAPSWLLDRFRARTLDQVQTLERILDEADEAGDGSIEVAAARRLEGLGEALDRVRRNLGARRATVWDVDAAGEQAQPWIASGGAAPKAVPLAGDPLHWAWQEGVQLQLESSPRWAADAAVAHAVPLERGGQHAALLTLEFDAEREPPNTGELEDAASYLRAFIRTQHEEARAVRKREYFSRVLDLLRRLPREIEPTAFAEELADTARAVTRGTGALVATWEGDGGRVLAGVGDDGGPQAGAAYEARSELAVAARGATTIVREDRRAGRRILPLGSADERWYASPRTLVVVPLADAAGTVLGVLAVWNARSDALNPQAVRVLEAVAPYAALQLQQLRAYRDLQEHVGRDPVTGLVNRRAFEEALEAEAGRFDRKRRPVAVLMLDIDHFKDVNDTYGHEAGDAVLRGVAETIRSSIRVADVAARYGGEEFVVLLPETRLLEARDAAERLRRAIETLEVAWNTETISITASVGVSSAPECVEHPTDMVGSADAMLYESKAAGRNRVTIAAGDRRSGS